jgi:2-polyprenyl-3-methyl-5-hydroxy-6-metoxy-1,4-benzoquinol methylase
MSFDRILLLFPTNARRHHVSQSSCERPTAKSSTTMSTYAIRGGKEGKRRLNLLAQIMSPTTDALLPRAGVRPGLRCLDLGCGGGHVSQRMACFVGPTGSVVGVDLDTVKLEAAMAERGVWA